MPVKTRYNDFDTFLKEVVDCAKIRSDILIKEYAISSIAIFGLMIIILDVAGFSLFSAISAMLILGWVGFSLELPILLTNPIVLIVFGATAGGAFWKIFRDRKIFMAVSEIGKRFKEPWERLFKQKSCKEDFDRLFKEAVVVLIVTPKEFYKNNIDTKEVEKMFKDYKL